jgi:hypothetical protein
MAAEQNFNVMYSYETDLCHVDSFRILYFLAIHSVLHTNNCEKCYIKLGLVPLLSSKYETTNILSKISGSHGGEYED